MDKLKTKILLISLLLLLLFSVQSVAAVSDDGENLTSESIDLSICDNPDDVISDEQSNNQSDVLSASNELNVLGADEVSYTILASEIGRLGNVKLQFDYYKWSGETNTITINEYKKIIDGNGAVIDMNGSSIQAFNVIGSGVTIKNLTIKNVNYNDYGGAICFFNPGSVENCNFVDNKATGDNGYGGSIFFVVEGTVTNCSFTHNSARSGGAIFFNKDSTGSVINCNFTNNTADLDGGAIFFHDCSSSSVINCNFTNNVAGIDGGAVHFNRECTVTNCNFTLNKAQYASAVYFYSKSDMTNCTFTGNKATDNFGAVYFNSEGNITNCNFTGNTAPKYGGAVYFNGKGTVTNCNFNNNAAINDGGAVYFSREATVTNCNFIGNTATTGSAIYFMSVSATKTVSNSRFLNNRANAEALEVTKNEDNLTITFIGQNNLLNAIYSRDDAEVSFNNVTYWGENGISNTDSSATPHSRSKNEAGLNITLEIYDSGSNLVENTTLRTDHNGQIEYNLSKLNIGKYRYHAYHREDNYYTSTEKNDIFNKYYDDFNLLQIYIKNANPNSVLTLYQNFTFAIGWDENLTEGIVIDKPITINGNGHTINALQKARIFSITTNNVVLNNITFKNATAYSNGGAIFFNGTGSILNCNFTDNQAGYGGAFYFNATGNVTNCNFANNSATHGGAVHFNKEITVTNCNFTNNTAIGDGGAVHFNKESTVTNCNFTNNTATNDGGAVYFNRESTVTNCNFTNNTAIGDGGAVCAWFNKCTISKCNFTNNKASSYNSFGGAICSGFGTVKNCNFINSKSNRMGGAVLFTHEGTVENCNFNNNTARSLGGAIMCIGFGTLKNCNFTNNTVTESELTYNEALELKLIEGCGGAVYIYSGGNVTNCNFANNTSIYEGGAVCSWFNNGTITKCNFTLNTAYYGGAIYFHAGTIPEVRNCNFIGNNATTGSAIYFWDNLTTKTVSNSLFLNNRANAEALEVTKNEDNITITFKGNDNLLNAIYSRDDAEVIFTNVTYWSAKGIDNTGSSPIKHARSKNEAGQNITVSIVINDVFVLNEVKVTDENGMIVLDMNVGENYCISVHHDADSYYSEAENTTSNNTKFNVNVTSKTTNDKTVNITAKSNIPNEIIKGELLFILPNGSEINANYAGKGIWWALHTFADYGTYKVNASYAGLDNVTVNNGTITINPNFKVSVVKSADASEVAYDSLVQFTIIVTNYGSSDVTEVDVSDCLPQGLTFVEAGVINSKGKYEIFDSPDLLILIDGEDYVTFNEFSSIDITKEGSADRDLVQYNITKITSGKSVVLLITARANGLVMGSITNEVTVQYHENETDMMVNSAIITVIPANSSVSADDVEVTYGKPIVVVVNSENATEVSYQVIGVDGVVKQGTVNVGENITGLDLAAGEYTVNLTTDVNGNYTSNSHTSKITVKPATSSVSAADIEVTYGDPIIVVVTSENATEVSYKVISADGVVKNGTVNVGENITGLDLAAGKYTVNLTTIVNSNYTSSNYTSKITVKPTNSTVKTANSSVNAEDISAVYGDPIVVVVNSENATEVSYKVIGTDGIVKQGTVNVSENITGLDLAAGKYTVNLTTIVTANYTTSSYISKITVKPANSTVNAEDVSVVYGDSIVVIVNSENATEVSYKVIGTDGIVKQGTVNVGENITGLDLATGEYTVNLTTIVNSNYTSSNYTSKITVKPTNSTVKTANSSVNAEDISVVYGNPIEVIVNSENATGVSYQVINSGTVVKQGTVNVGEKITGLDLGAGEYTVNLTTIVNANYTANNYTSKITVIRANSSISADNVEVTYGETVTIPVSVVNATEFYYAIVNANGTTVDSDIIQAGLNITVENLSAGKYNVTLITGVDSNHTSVINASKITVNPAGSSVSAEDTVASLGDTVSIPVSSVNATEISYSIIDVNGKAIVNGTVKPGESVNVSDLAAGDYTVNLIAVVDANHTRASNSSKLHIKHIVTINIAQVIGRAGEVVSFTAQLKYENGNPVNEGTASLTINYDEGEVLAASMNSILSADESVPVSNGKAEFNVKLGAPGKYQYVVSYSGSDTDDTQAESTLTIIKADTTVSGVDVSGKPADKKDITVTVSDQDNNPANNGTVTLTLNGETYTATVEKGKAVLSIELPNPGSYNATVTYNGNDYYNSSSSSIAVDVKKVNTKSPSTEDVSGKAGEKTDITVKFVDENGNPIKNGTATLTIDGKTYTAEVINGIATFKDVVLPDEDTVADVYYQGNDCYNASSATFSIKVKHDNNNTEPDNNDTDENKTTKHASFKIADTNATGNPIAMMLLALFVIVITYRKKIKL